MKNTVFLLVLKSTFFVMSLGSMNLPSPRSPRDRKTKSPGSFGSGSSISILLESPRCSPRYKRKKTVSISETALFHEYNDNCDNNENYGEFIKEEESLQNITTLPPVPILKRRFFTTRKYSSTIKLFRNGSAKELDKFYSQGTQLTGEPAEIHEMFKYLIETGQVDKLRTIYEHDKANVLDFIMKGGSVDVLELVSVIFVGNEQLILKFQSETDSVALRTAVFLNAVDFKIEPVYKMLNELIEDENSRILGKEIIKEYYKDENRIPFLAHAAKTDSEEALQSILAFEPSEIDRLDSKGCSVLYHAAFEGNLDILNLLKDSVKGKPLVGQCPLIGAALSNRSDIISFFLEDKENSSREYFNFSQQEIEDAAFASAIAGHIGVLRVLKRATDLNLHCYRGNNTLLSTALKNDKIGYAMNLIERFGFNVNFVGDDAVNPEGHALIFVLDKPTTCEFFIRKGANRNILVAVLLGDSEIDADGPLRYVPLKEYLEMSGNEKLIKLFNKYS